MDYYDIHRLNRNLPASPKPPAQQPPPETIPSGYARLSIEETSNFLEAYNNPAFGWFAASRLHEAKVSNFPVWPGKKMAWVFKAWQLLSKPEMFGDDPRFEPIRHAYDINCKADQNMIRGVLEAALVTREGSVVEIAKHTGIRPAVIEAYDALFFNALDRKEDKLFLRNIVYPCTRLEELVERYISKASLNRVLLRLGYNKGLNEVLYFAGFQVDYLQELTSAQAQDLFQKETMLQGYLLASAGFLNFEKQHVSLSSARALVQAAKLGGEATGGEQSTGTFAAIVSQQLEADVKRLESHILQKAGV